MKISASVTVRNFLIATYFNLIIIQSAVNGVEIRELVVPPLIHFNKSSEAVLDCNFDYSEEEADSGIVVMWYFEGEVTPFIQWIATPPGRKPQLIDNGGRFAGKVDLDYVTPGEEANPAKKHRSLRLLNIDPSLSGAYRCKVSTLFDEDFKQKSMIIYAPVTQIEFSTIAAENDSVRVSCATEAVFPEPDISIYWGDEDDNSVLPALSVSANDRNPLLFDAEAAVTLSHDRFTESEIFFVCQISLGESSDLVARETSLYYPGNKRGVSYKGLRSVSSEKEIPGQLFTFAIALLSATFHFLR